MAQGRVGSFIRRLCRAYSRGRTGQFCLHPRRSSFPKFLEVPHHLHAALITLCGIFRHRSSNDVIESRRQLGIEKGRRYRIAIDYLVRDGEGAVALKRLIACQDRVQNHTQGKQVRPPIHGFAVQLFRRHISGRAEQTSCLSLVGKVQFSHAEVGDFGMAVFGQQDICGLQITVNHALSVGAIQRFRQFER